MEKVDINFITELSFQYDLKHKNFGMVHADEPFDLFYDGTITKLRTETGGYPETIGIFILNVINLNVANLFDCKDQLIESIVHRSTIDEDCTYGMKKLMDDPDINFLDKDKIIFLKTVIIHPKYRNKGVFEELVKSIYMTHHTTNSLFVISGKPIQAIKGELEFLSDLTWDVWEHEDDKHNEKKEVNVGEFFELDTLPYDDEMNEYKLYAKFQSMNLKKYGDTHFFYYHNNFGFWQFLESYSSRFKLLPQ